LSMLSFIKPNLACHIRVSNPVHRKHQQYNNEALLW
jgi:hypothetical protein